MEDILKQTMKSLLESDDIGLVWPSYEPLLAAVRSELDEIEETVKNNESFARLLEEIGDLLIASIELCRFFKVSPIEALTLAEQKFSKRLNKMKEIMTRGGATNLSNLSFEDRRSLWQDAKREISKAEFNSISD